MPPLTQPIDDRQLLYFLMVLESSGKYLIGLGLAREACESSGSRLCAQLIIWARRSRNGVVFRGSGRAHQDAGHAGGAGIQIPQAVLNMQAHC